MQAIIQIIPIILFLALFVGVIYAAARLAEFVLDRVLSDNDEEDETMPDNSILIDPSALELGRNPTRADYARVMRTLADMERSGQFGDRPAATAAKLSNHASLDGFLAPEDEARIIIGFTPTLNDSNERFADFLAELALAIENGRDVAPEEHTKTKLLQRNLIGGLDAVIAFVRQHGSMSDDILMVSDKVSTVAIEAGYWTAREENDLAQSFADDPLGFIEFSQARKAWLTERTPTQDIEASELPAVGSTGALRQTGDKRNQIVIAFQQLVEMAAAGENIFPLLGALAEAAAEEGLLDPAVREQLYIEARENGSPRPSPSDMQQLALKLSDAVKAGSVPAADSEKRTAALRLRNISGIVTSEGGIKPIVVATTQKVIAQAEANGWLDKSTREALYAAASDNAAGFAAFTNQLADLIEHGPVQAEQAA